MSSIMSNPRRTRRGHVHGVRGWFPAGRLSKACDDGNQKDADGCSATCKVHLEMLSFALSLFFATSIHEMVDPVQCRLSADGNAPEAHPPLLILALQSDAVTNA